MALYQKFCPSLPSSEYAYNLVEGPDRLHAAAGVVGTSLFRGALIAAGITVFGKPGPDLARNALAGAAMVELFVLGWIAFKSANAKNNPPTPPPGVLD